MDPFGPCTAAVETSRASFDANDGDSRTENSRGSFSVAA